jgi:2-dehydro-3-deoxygluconokinase
VPAAPEPLRFEQMHALDVHVAGAEISLAIALARLGKRAVWFSWLPNTPLGRRALCFIAQSGVDVSDVQRVPNERVGLLFSERGALPRPR